jgi:hypothetical protein
MFMLVSLERAKQMLHVEHNDDNELLELLISAASRSVVRYLKGQAGELLSIDSPPNSPTDDLGAVPEDVAAAIIMFTGIMYRNPDNDVEAAFASGYLPAPVKVLLYPLRDPALA